MATRQKGVVVPISATDNTARAFDSVNEKVKALQSEVARLRATGAGPGDAIATGMSHAGPQVAAASGLIREFEGNLPIRAVERFLATTLGLGPILSKAFPIIGAVAVGEAIFEAGEKFVEMEQKAAKAAETIKKEFGEVTGELRRANEEAVVTADKLEDDILKLEKKPGDGLQTALDEATLAADRLAASLDKDLDKVKELLDKNKVGFFGGLASGTGETKDTSNLVLYEKKQIDDLRHEYDAVVAQARVSGNKDDVDQAVQARLVALQKAYANADDVLSKAQSAVQHTLDHRRSPAATLGAGLTVQGSGVTYSSSRDNSDNANILSGARQLLLQEQNEIGTDFRKSQDEKKKGLLEAAKNQDELAKKAEAERVREAAAQEKAAAADRSLADASAKAKAALQKAATDQELDELETSHRELLVSDEDYYRQREAIQARAIQNQRDAIASQRTNLEQQIGGARVSGVGLTGADAITNNSKIVELQAKLVELDAKDAQLTGEAAKNTRIRADAEADLARRRIADADSLAAQLENERGGSVTARQRQNTDEYKQRRRQLEGEYGIDSPVLYDLDDQHALDQDSIGAKGAEQTFNSADSDIRSRRSQVGDAQSRGQISNNAAQQQRIALDREEADALQPVLEAYEQLAKDGDLAAVDKVTDLKRRIAELKDPINDTAAEVRNQLDASFEALFENIDKGKRGLADFGKALEKAVTRDAFKQFVEPGLQAGLGLLIPNGPRGGSGIPTGSSAATAALSGLIPKAAPTLAGVAGSIFGVSKGKGGVTVEIINQTSQPVQSASATQSSLDNELEQKVISIVLENTNTGGVLSSLFNSL